MNLWYKIRELYPVLQGTVGPRHGVSVLVRDWRRPRLGRVVATCPFCAWRKGGAEFNLDDRKKYSEQWSEVQNLLVQHLRAAHGEFENDLWGTG